MPYVFYMIWRGVKVIGDCTSGTNKDILITIIKFEFQVKPTAHGASFFVV